MARVVVTVAEVSEERLTAWSALITAAIGIEAWRAFAVSRVAKREHREPPPIRDSGWDRFLRPLEHAGPAVIYSLTVAFVVAALLIGLLGNPHDVLLDVAIVAREITTFVFLAVIVAAYMSVRRAPR